MKRMKRTIGYSMLMLIFSLNLTCSEQTLSAEQHQFSPPTKILVKGIYVSPWTLHSKKQLNQTIHQVEQTELNAMVIDVKDDEGRISYDSKVKQVDQIQSDRNPAIKDVRKLLTRLSNQNIYPIARIVTFKDPYASVSIPQWAMKNKNGTIWRDTHGVAWVDPHIRAVWDYNLAIAKEAAKLGFKEIQFDYVRFPVNSRNYQTQVVHSDHRAKQDVISDFLSYAKNQLKPYPVYVSADVFGLTTTVNDDMGIGQNWSKISSIVDVISPMMYPSHYAKGSYGLKNPDASPYQTILHGLKDAKQKNQKLKLKGLKSATIRPWLQDFTASWVSGHIVYGTKQVEQQIAAARQLGYEEYLLWNTKNQYHPPK